MTSQREVLAGLSPAGRGASASGDVIGSPSRCVPAGEAGTTPLPAGERAVRRDLREAKSHGEPGEGEKRSISFKPSRSLPRSDARVVLFVEENGGDWHARRLAKALEARGASVVTTTLKDCAFDTRLPSGVDIPGFDGVLPDGAFVRSVSAGGLEQITFRLGILHALRESGVRVWNDARAIERCVDKSTATFLFQRAGLPVPLTRTVEGEDAAARHRDAIGSHALVVKPLFGSQGNGVRRVDAGAPLPAPEEVGCVYYTQDYLRAKDAGSFEDWRVFVSSGRVLAAMARRGKTWVTNVHQGAEPAPHEPDDEMRRLALAAVAAVGADYAGVDLIRAADGRLLVLEINSNPAWKGLQGVTHVDIADALAEDFLASVREAKVTTRGSRQRVSGNE